MDLIFHIWFFTRIRKSLETRLIFNELLGKTRLNRNIRSSPLTLPLSLSLSLSYSFFCLSLSHSISILPLHPHPFLPPRMISNQLLCFTHKYSPELSRPLLSGGRRGVRRESSRARGLQGEEKRTSFYHPLLVRLCTGMHLWQSFLKTKNILLKM